MMSESMFQQLEICQQQRDAARSELSALREELARTERYMEINANSAHGKHKEGQRYRDERDALQLRLNAADQRIDDLLAEIATVRLGPCKMIVGDELP